MPCSPGILPGTGNHLSCRGHGFASDPKIGFGDNRPVVFGRCALLGVSKRGRIDPEIDSGCWLGLVPDVLDLGPGALSDGLFALGATEHPQGKNYGQDDQDCAAPTTFM